VDDAQLYLSFREYGLDGFGKAFEPVNTGDNDVIDAAVLEFGDDREPELVVSSSLCK